jgi:hypothetical protein
MAENVTVTREPTVHRVRITELINRVSWGAIWAGVMIALGMEVLFAFFGTFIGFGMYNYQSANPWGGISAWTTIWYLVTAGWSMFFGAWCAARLSGNPTREAGILHGVSTWGLAALATMLIVAVGAWAILREGIGVLTTATIAGLPAVTPAAQQAGAVANQVRGGGPMAQATASILSGISLRVWGGVLLGLITSILGGWLGRAHNVIVQTEETQPVPTRLAA